MTTPSPKFVTADDVTERYEGSFPTDRMSWLLARIADVEAQLMGDIPSLRKPMADILADNVTSNDPSRMDRVKTIICSKVLDLFRNPEGVSQLSRTMPDLATTRTFTTGGTTGRVAFTEDELDAIRLHTNRSVFGSAIIDSWKTRDRGYWY